MNSVYEWVDWDEDTKALLVLDDFFKFRFTDESRLQSRFLVSRPLLDLKQANWEAVKVIMDFHFDYRPYMNRYHDAAGKSGWAVNVMGRYFPGGATIRTSLFDTKEQAEDEMLLRWRRAQKNLHFTAEALMISMGHPEYCR